MLEPLHIVIDTREQCPWAWDPSDAITEVRALVAGDYALLEDCENVKGKQSLSVKFAIERKSLNDFLSSVSVGWARFNRELTRMETFPARVIIVEGNFSECCFSQDEGCVVPPSTSHPMLTPSFVARRISELTMMGVSVLLAGNSQLAAGLAYRIFRRRFEKDME